MKKYLKKDEYNSLFFVYFQRRWLFNYIELNEFAKYIISDDWLTATYTKQSIYRFINWAHTFYQLMYFMYC